MDHEALTGTEIALTSPTPDRCTAALIHTDHERAIVDNTPDGDRICPSISICELHSQHDGPHHSSISIVTPSREWWIRWDTRQGLRQFVELADCTAIAPTLEGGNCMLHLNHPGPHTKQHISEDIWWTSPLEAIAAHE